MLLALKCNSTSQIHKSSRSLFAFFCSKTLFAALLCWLQRTYWALNRLLAQCHMNIQASGCPWAKRGLLGLKRVSQVQLPEEEVLSQRFAGKRFIEKNSRAPAGQREMWNHSAATTEASPTGSSGAGMSFRTIYNWAKVARSLCTPTATDHGRQLPLGRQCDFGWGVSAAMAIPRWGFSWVVPANTPRSTASPARSWLTGKLRVAPPPRWNIPWAPHLQVLLQRGFTETQRPHQP